MRIKAEVHDDNHTHHVSFDAEEWFKSAEDYQIRELAKEGWTGSYVSDSVAIQSSDPAVRRFFDLLESANAFFPQGLGFEVLVIKDDAMDYLAMERPDLFLELTDRP